MIGLCAESHCEFQRPLAFPETVTAGLRVGHLGRSSVRYEIGLYGEDAATPAATGWFVHVFVDRETRRPVDIPPRLRSALRRSARLHLLLEPLQRATVLLAQVGADERGGEAVAEPGGLDLVGEAHDGAAVLRLSS